MSARVIVVVCLTFHCMCLCFAPRSKPAFGESAIHSESVTSSKVQIDEAPSIHSIHSVHSGPSKQSLPSLHEASHTSAPAPGGSVYDEGQTAMLMILFDWPRSH